MVRPLEISTLSCFFFCLEPSFCFPPLGPITPSDGTCPPFESHSRSGVRPTVSLFPPLQFSKPVGRRRHQDPPPLLRTFIPYKARPGVLFTQLPSVFLLDISETSLLRFPGPSTEPFSFHGPSLDFPQANVVYSPTLPIPFPSFSMLPVSRSGALLASRPCPVRTSPLFVILPIFAGAISSRRLPFRPAGVRFTFPPFPPFLQVAVGIR